MGLLLFVVVMNVSKDKAERDELAKEISSIEKNIDNYSDKLNAAHVRARKGNEKLTDLFAKNKNVSNKIKTLTSEREALWAQLKKLNSESKQNFQERIDISKQLPISWNNKFTIEEYIDRNASKIDKEIEVLEHDLLQIRDKSDEWFSRRKTFEEQISQLKKTQDSTYNEISKIKKSRDVLFDDKKSQKNLLDKKWSAW